jgi:hypothetical protein
MAPVATEHRIFADRAARAGRRQEALHAGRVSPGCTTWGAALEALYRRMNKKVASPIKQAAILHDVIAYLTSVAPEQRAHLLIGSASKSRSAMLCFASFSADTNPLAGADEDGISIRLHRMHCDRHGAGVMIVDEPSAYISKHALARIHERENAVNQGNFVNVVCLVGALGWLAQTSAKHINGMMCLTLDDSLVVGNLKHATQHCRDGTSHVAAFIDIRTALSVAEIDEDDARRQAMIEQGRIAYDVVRAWFDQPAGNDHGMADRIPFLPCDREDYTARAADAYVASTRRQVSEHP